MTDLNHSFNKAIQVFTHASDFIVSLYEGSIMYAEDLIDQLARERNLYQMKDYPERLMVEREIGASTAFLGKLIPSFLIIQIALLEDCLLEICEEAAHAKGIPFTLGKFGHFTLEGGKSFLENELGIPLPNPWPAWEKIQEVQKMRNDLLDHSGLMAESGEVDDQYLVGINETIVLFFEELQSQMLDVESHPDPG